MPKPKKPIKKAVVADDPIQFVKCTACGNEQADMGKNMKCEVCGAAPMPWYEDGELCYD